jgi:hypothetical protein
MRSNDKIPEDEMLLAEAYAAAGERHLRWTKMKPFAHYGRRCKPGQATEVCALGALYLAGRTPLSTAQVWAGNDLVERWSGARADMGESLGWAFRCAMTQDESDPATERLIRERSGK